MRFRSSYALAFLVACGGDPGDPAPVEDHGFLLVARSARAMNPTLDDGTAVGAMPVALTGKRYTLALGERAFTIEPDTSLLTYAHDADGSHDTLILGGDVYADRLAIAGEQAAASRIAEELGVAIEASGDGRWILRGEDVWLRTATLDAIAGVSEVFPISITDGGGVIGVHGGVGRMVVAAPSSPRATSPDVIDAVSPALAKCEDPIAGVWIARTYRAEQYDWHEFTLTMKRTAQGTVDGSIAVRLWAGDSSSAEIGSCDDGSPALGLATMSAHGTWKGNHLRFAATRLESAPSVCGESREYNLDRFTATLRKDGVLAATNNDGDAARDRPYQFTRISCQ